MNDALTEQVRAQLLARRDEILERKHELVQELIDDVADRIGDTIDVTTDEQIEATRLRIESRFARELTEIDAALHRMSDGTWGECDECGDEIGRKRLSAMPLAKLCVDCQEEAETDARRRYKRPGLMDEFN